MSNEETIGQVNIDDNKQIPVKTQAGAFKEVIDRISKVIEDCCLVIIPTQDTDDAAYYDEDIDDEHYEDIEDENDYSESDYSDSDDED